MVLPKIRMQNLRGKLALVRCGKGAAIMDPSVKRLDMTFPFKNPDGNMGARKFWQMYMPSLKFHNPSVEMNVQRTREIGGPSTLTIEFDSDRKEVLDLKYQEKTDICTQVLNLTKATPIPTSEEDNKILLQYDAFKKRQAQKLANQKARKAEQKVAGRKMNISPLQ